MNFLVLGPITVGIPVLANTQLAEGAAAFGIIMSAFGGGALLGIILASALPALKPERLGAMLLLIISFMGIGLALMPLLPSTAAVAVLALLMGMTNGYTTISLFTWLQKRVPQELMGRVMSLILFSSVGLAPISNALAGAILQVNLNALFIGGGLLMALISLLSIALPAVRQMGLEPVAAAPAA
jgi:MFS family permease